ncbi:MAG: YigZ family protein [Dokdonella sp.]
MLHTLTGTAELTQEIRKSRFRARAAPIDDPAAALAELIDLGDPAATHNCWAYRVNQQYRFSDDGEPGGSAGKPILQATDSQGFDRVVVVVTRWYGGTKLGVGGLARAYGGCAAECLRLATAVPIVDHCGLRVRCDFAIVPILRARLADFAAEIVDETFSATGATLEIRVPRDRLEAFEDLVRDLSRGRAVIELG